MKTPPKQPAPDQTLDSSKLTPEEAKMQRLEAMRAYISLRNMPHGTLEEAKAHGALTSRDEKDSEL